MGTIYLAEITAAIDAAGTLTTLRYSSGRGYNDPSAPGYYEPRISQPANINRTIFDSLTTFGEGKISYGELVLKNPDGGIDNLLQYGYGRSAVIKIGDSAAAYSSFVTILSGVIEQVTASLTDLSLMFRDRTQELEAAVQVATFAGTNSGPTGIEGTPDTIGGQPKPRIFGICKQVTPAPVNTSQLIYAVNYDRSGNTAAIFSVDGVYDGGAALSLDTTIGTSGNCSNLSALQAANPAAGKYATCLSAGLFKLGASPSKTITCDITEGAAAINNRVANIIDRLLLDAGVASGDISSSDISTLDSNAPYQAGIFINDNSSYHTILDQLAGSVGAWYAPNNLNQYRIVQLNSPTGSPVCTFKKFSHGIASAANDGDITSLELVASNDNSRGVPYWNVSLDYCKVWTVQAAGSLAGGITDEMRGYLGSEFRTVTASDSTIQQQFLQASELALQSLLINAADAQAVCNAQLILRKVLRTTFNLKVRLSSDIIGLIDLGAVVNVTLPRFSLNSGKLFVITGLQYDAEQNELEITIWG